MTMWKYSEHGGVNVAVKRGEEIEHLGDALRLHNADIAAMEAKLKEAMGESIWEADTRRKDNATYEARIADLQRRLDAILELAPDGDLDYREIRAIAEGRDNG